MKYNNEKHTSIKSRTDKVKLDWVWIFMIFLLAANLFAKEGYLLIGVIIIGLFICGYKGSRFKPTIDLLMISLFSLAYFTIYSIHKGPSLSLFFLYVIVPISCFFIGYFIVKFDKEIVTKTILAVATGMFFHGFLNMILYFKAFGTSSSIRSVPDVWTGVQMAATLQGTYFTLVVSLLFFSYIQWEEKNKVFAIFLIMGAVFSISSSLILGNRTLILIMILVFVLNLLLYTFILKTSQIKVFKMWLLIGVSLLVLGGAYSMDLLGIKDFVLGSNFYSRVGTSGIGEDPRFVVQSSVISQMFDYPFGGYNINLGLNSYAHNLWLDVLVATGLIPFLLLIVYTLKVIMNLFMVIKNRHVDRQCKFMMFSITFGFLINFMVEPILDGIPYMFMLFCLLNGMIKKYLDVLRESS
jgi:hypothetical protein